MLILVVAAVIVGLALLLFVSKPSRPSGDGHDRAAKRELNWYGS
jgi:hypothetical protein